MKRPKTPNSSPVSSDSSSNSSESEAEFDYRQIHDNVEQLPEGITDHITQQYCESNEGIEIAKTYYNQGGPPLVFIDVAGVVNIIEMKRYETAWIDENEQSTTKITVGYDCQWRRSEAEAF